MGRWRVRVSKFVRLGLVAACLALLAVSPVVAASPTIVREDINIIGEPSPELSDLCGFDVWIDVSGHITEHRFVDSEGNLTRQVINYDLLVTYHSETGSVFTVNVGPDRVWVNDDGSITLLTTGNIESLHGPGNGGAYQDVGFTELIIDGEDVTFVTAPGQHDGNHDEVLCELLS
jgi:hypothetical protein